MTPTDFITYSTNYHETDFECYNHSWASEQDPQGNFPLYDDQSDQFAAHALTQGNMNCPGNSMTAPIIHQLPIVGFNLNYGMLSLKIANKI